MSQVSHFVLRSNGIIEEVPADAAAAVAMGDGALPAYADARVRYLQVIVDDSNEDNTIQVRTAGALVSFDHQGRLSAAADAAGEHGAFTRFEHDTCVQLALKGVVDEDVVRH